MDGRNNELDVKGMKIMLDFNEKIKENSVRTNKVLLVKNKNTSNFRKRIARQT